MRRSTVISGLGTASALGLTPRALWLALCEGRTGIGPVTRVDLTGFACKLAGEVRPTGPDGSPVEFSAREYVPKPYRKATKVMARDIEIAVACAQTATQDAGIVTRATEGGTPTYAGERIGCQIGAGLIAAEAPEIAAALATALSEQPVGNGATRPGFDYRAWGTVASPGQQTGGMENLPPLWMLKYLPNMLACHVTIIHGAEGPSNTLTCAEASGLLCIGEGSRIIERGGADVCFSGSAESKLNLTAIMRLTSAQRLARVGSGQSAADACRPYDPTSTGSIPGEGGGIVIIEEASFASARGVTPYAQVAGFGAAHSTTNLLPPFAPPRPTDVNEGLASAIRAAMRDAGVSASDIDAVVPQASGCPFFDVPEAGALDAVFGKALPRIDIIALVPSIGDCFAGNGGLQAAVAALCLKHGALPARRMRLRRGSGGGLEAHPAPAGEPGKNGGGGSAGGGPRHILVCSGSMGGQNAALVLRKAGLN